MFDHVLFPTDGSEAAARALDYVADVAETYDATLHVVNVADTTTADNVPFQEEVVDALETEGERIVEEAADRVRDRLPGVVTDVVRGVPHRAIVEYADGHDIDLVVLPTHGRTGLRRFLLGSVAERVVRTAEMPVLTLRAGEDFDATCPHERVLVPTDGSAPATAALDVGIDAAKTQGAALDVLSVVDVTSLGLDVHSEMHSESLEGAAEDAVSEATERAAAAGIESVSGAVRRGTSVPAEIRSYVEERDVDLLVVGTHGRTGVDRYLLGSVAERLVRTASVPVLTVRRS